MLRLIINADDLGLTHGVNNAVIEANRQGVVTSATLMADSQAFSDAVARLKESEAYRSRKLSVGCHIVLVGGNPTLPPERVPSLLEPGAAVLPRNFTTFAAMAMRGRISSAEVAAEATSQIRRIQEAGIELSHVDCHKHAHMFQAVLDGVARAASDCGIRAIRNPFQPPDSLPLSLLVESPGLWVRAAETATLRRLYAKRFGAAIHSFGLATTRGSIGVTITGAMNPKRLAKSLSNLPDGDYELVCHPGYNDAALAQAGTRLLESRERELEILKSPETRKLLGAQGIELISFWELQPKAVESNSCASRPMV